MRKYILLILITIFLNGQALPGNEVVLIRP